MLSIIICSIHQHLLDGVKKSIANTVGVEYELLIWNNKEEQLGLCAVYNKMATQAKYPYLCFCHEDILFETENWGYLLKQLFENNSSVGLVGIAGSTYKSGNYSGWFTGIEDLDYFKIIHEVKGVEIELISPPKYSFAQKKVACIDGVFMACSKTVWQTFKFNEKLLQGFHFYDIDFSLRVALAMDVIVTDKILLRHITKGGDYGDRWVEAAFLFHEASKEALPFAIDTAHSYSIDLKIAANWMDRLKSEKISFRNRLKWIRSQGLHKRTPLIYTITKFLLYEPLGLQKVHRLFKSSN